MITDRQIKAAISEASLGKRRIELRDNGDRGAGRLVLLIRRSKRRVVSEWYAFYYSNSKRQLTKIGSYPAVTLLDARKLFRDEYAPVIRTGAKPSNPYARLQHRKSHLSVEGLFKAYVQHLKVQGKGCSRAVERLLLERQDNAADGLGRHRAAKSIQPAAIVAYLAQMHARGTIGMAHNTRAYIRSAYAFAMKSEHSYTREVGDGQWGITSNPVAAIPTDVAALRVGNRHLSPLEFRTFWDWLLENEQRWFIGPSLRLIMVTGQRVQEVLRVRDVDYDKKELMLYWAKTKNGRPHSIPLPSIAVGILDNIKPTPAGWLFPHRFDKTRHAISTTPNKICELYSEETGEKRFTPRDLRRTWKTLAGRAGIPKDMRDRLQNHGQTQDVSTRHYDRYDYLPERRAAMAKWNGFVLQLLAGKLDGLANERLNTVAA